MRPEDVWRQWRCVTCVLSVQLQLLDKWTYSVLLMPNSRRSKSSMSLHLPVHNTQYPVVNLLLYGLVTVYHITLSGVCQCAWYSPPGPRVPFLPQSIWWQRHVRANDLPESETVGITRATSRPRRCNHHANTERQQFSIPYNRYKVNGHCVNSTS